MLQPRKPKYRKQMKRARRIKQPDNRGTSVAFGDFGLKATEGGWITSRQVEAGRVAVNRTAKRGGKLWIRMYPDKPITSKPAETRMGKGKGSPDHWVAEVRPGRIMYEITGVEPELAKKALARAAAKLPIACTVVERKRTLM